MRAGIQQMPVGMQHPGESARLPAARPPALSDAGGINRASSLAEQREDCPQRGRAAAPSWFASAVQNQNRIAGIVGCESEFLVERGHAGTEHVRFGVGKRDDDQAATSNRGCILQELMRGAAPSVVYSRAADIMQRDRYDQAIDSGPDANCVCAR